MPVKLWKDWACCSNCEFDSSCFICIGNELHLSKTFSSKVWLKFSHTTRGILFHTFISYYWNISIAKLKYYFVIWTVCFFESFRFSYLWQNVGSWTKRTGRLTGENLQLSKVKKENRFAKKDRQRCVLKILVKKRQ